MREVQGNGYVEELEKDERQFNDFYAELEESLHEDTFQEYKRQFQSQNQSQIQNQNIEYPQTQNYSQYQSSYGNCDYF